jgi:hypothetical protein
MDKLSAMQAFCRIDDRGSFARASEDLGVSAALLSREIRLLEDSLGTTLITRTTRRMSLTEAGVCGSMRPHPTGSLSWPRYCRPSSGATPTCASA